MTANVLRFPTFTKSDVSLPLCFFLIAEITLLKVFPPFGLLMDCPSLDINTSQRGNAFSSYQSSKILVRNRAGRVPLSNTHSFVHSSFHAVNTHWLYERH